MSTPIWDLAQSTLNLGYHLNEFLYEGKVRNNIPKEHTNEELVAELERIRKRCFDEYRDVAREMGWEEE